CPVAGIPGQLAQLRGDGRSIHLLAAAVRIGYRPLVRGAGVCDPRDPAPGRASGALRPLCAIRTSRPLRSRLSRVSLRPLLALCAIRTSRPLGTRISQVSLWSLRTRIPCVPLRPLGASQRCQLFLREVIVSKRIAFRPLGAVCTRRPLGASLSRVSLRTCL